MSTIKNPIEWSGSQFAHAAEALASLARSLNHIQERVHSPAPQVRRIGFDDLRQALAKGLEDFEAYRTDVLILGVVYAVLGLVLARLTFTGRLLPLLFPLASGFAIIGPVAAVGLYEMSRRREQGAPVSWANGFELVREPAFGALAVLGALLVAVFLCWLAAAWLIYQATLGPVMPASFASFLHDAVATPAGHEMIAVGCSVGFLFALFAMTISVVSFPLLIDRDVGLDTAIATSARAVWRNPLAMAGWGAIVSVGLVLGSLPFFVGLAVVLPVLGHATWHLYRRLVA